MDSLGLIGDVHEFVWGLLVDWISFVGIFLTLGLEFMPLRLIGFGVRQAWQSLRHSEGEGSISAFGALMTALGGNVGTGSLAGMALTVSLGGPGSIFWFWVVTIVGMAVKFAETLLAIKFRTHNERGEWVGGPMYFMARGLSKRWAWMGAMFAGVGTLAVFGLGNGVQAMELSHTLNVSMGLPRIVSGCLVAALTLGIISGGIQRISRVSAVLVPVMLLGYGAFMVVMLLIHSAAIPDAIKLIFNDAFSGKAVAGGALTVTVASGVRRAIFTQETGMGTTPIVHAVARPNDPVLQGTIAMLGNLITALVATSTGLLVICSETYLANQDGITMLSRAFDWGIPHSAWVGIVATVLFTFSTLIVFAYYGERCLEYLAGSRSNRLFRLIWVGSIVVASLTEIDALWLTTETLNSIMSIPNLIAIVVMSSSIFAITKSYNFKAS